MKKRVILTTVIAAVLLTAAIAAGLNAVFTVTHVRAEFTTYSESGKEEARELREELDGFLGKSTTFLDLNEVAAVVEKYPFFRLERLEKQYPTTVSLTVSERRETYAVQTESGYETFADNGIRLRSAEKNENRAGGENILLEGFFFRLAGSPASLNGDYAESLLASMNAFSSVLGEIRANILSVTLVRPTSEKRADFFRIRMREGVVVDIANPAEYAAEKAEAAVRRYLALGDEEHMFGFITAVDGAGGAILTDYSRSSTLG